MKLAMIIFTGLILVSCGSGFVEGWRSPEKVTDAERCERRGGWLWQNEQCVNGEDADMNLVDDKSLCDQVVDTIWYEDSCQRYRDLPQKTCESFDELDLVWAMDRCMSLTEYVCVMEEKRYHQGVCYQP